MIFLILGMLLVGVFLSAFFSGSETGFYRATRVRLVIDALGGDTIARGLWWLTNNPAMFVATTLIGNNLANYITSLAIVLGAKYVFAGSKAAELLAPMALAPLLFVYGELLPKNLFYHAPNALLRRSGPLFLVCMVLFFPISVLLWLLSRGLQALVGEAPEQLRLALARAELARILEEGHEAGILKPAQRQLAQGLFAMANEPVLQFATPAARMASVRRGSPKREALRLARRHRLAAIPVEEFEGHQRHLVGYVRVIDLHLQQDDAVETVRPLLQISSRETQISALIRMENEGETLARVVDAKGHTLGFLRAQQLTDPLFRRGG